MTLARVADGYANLAIRLAGEWRAHITEVSSRPGPVTADQAVADTVAAARLLAESAFLFGSETLDAIAVLKGPEAQLARSDVYGAPPADAELALVDDFTNLHGYPLPLSALRIVRLDPADGNTRFYVRADAEGQPSGRFRGTVIVAKDAVELTRLPVRLTIA